MARWLSIGWLFFFPLLTGRAQSVPEGRRERTRDHGAHARMAAGRIGELVRRGQYFIEKPGSEKADLDSGMACLNQALELSSANHSAEWTNEALKWKGDCYLEGGQLDSGNHCFKKVIDYYLAHGNKRKAAETWLRNGTCMPEYAGREEVKCYEQALRLYKELGDQRMVRLTQTEIDSWLQMGELPEGLKQGATARQMMARIDHSAYDTNRIALLVELGRYYVEKPGSEREDLDSGLACFNQALTLSDALHSRRWTIETLKWKGDCYLEGDDLASGEACFGQVTSYYHFLGDRRREAESWSRLGSCIVWWKDSFFGLAKVHAYRHAALLFNQLKDTLQIIQLYSRIGEFYLSLPGVPHYLDSALYFSSRGLLLEEQVGDPKMLNDLHVLNGICYLRRGEVVAGELFFQKAADYYHRQNNYQEESKTLLEFGDDCPYADSNFLAARIRFYARAVTLNRGMQDTASETAALLKLSAACLSAKETGQAEKAALRALALNEYRSNAARCQSYEQLGRISRITGELHKELYYDIEMMKVVTPDVETMDRQFMLNEMGIAFEKAGFVDKALVNYRNALISSRKEKDWVDYIFYAQKIVQDLVREDSAMAALVFIQSAVHEHSAKSPGEQVYQAEAFGRCYAGLHQYAKAEKYYLQMARISDSMYKRSSPAEPYSRENCVINLLLVSDLYITMHRYEEAAFYFNKIKIQPYDVLSFTSMMNMQQLKFRMDSVTGRYADAIRDFRVYKQLNDSFYRADNIRQIEEYRIQGEAEQKEKDILLQSKNIAVLAGQRQVHEKEARESRTARNMVGGGFCMLALILGMGYSRYNLKLRKNRELELKQQQVSAKNEELMGLLNENDWLLREVHHRVKNNLQIVTSLLNSQAAYLQDEKALEAIAASRQRVQAMSLIHQKLYQSGQAAVIIMPEYINDLLDHLRDTLQIDRRVLFLQDIAAEELDIGYAAPLGLIINELVTNAVKYAFPHSEEDAVTVRLYHTHAGELVLEIADNGKGLPADFDMLQESSFGMTLVKELVRELTGEIDVESHRGTMVRIRVPAENFVAGHPRK